MADFVDFLENLLSEGAIVFRHKPVLEQGERAGALALLRRYYAEFALDVAGPALALEADVALAAAELVRQAAWFLVHRGEPAGAVDRQLSLPPPRSAADHASADLTLRFLPQVLRRARAQEPDDTLTECLVKILRHWPLSGVLADVADEPLTPLDFDGHPGLLFLYAERLARNEKPAWLPKGRPLEFVELVYHDLGKERVERPLLGIHPDERPNGKG